MLTIIKRNNQKDTFQPEKIALAIKKGFDSIENENYSSSDVHFIYQQVLSQINQTFDPNAAINIEQIQDIIEKQLIKHRYQDVYESFSSYRLARSESRQIFISKQHKFLKAIEKFSFTDHPTNLLSYQQLIEFGNNIASEFAKSYLINQQCISAHEQGRIYIHQISTYPTGTINSLVVDVYQLLDDSITLENIKFSNITTFNVCSLLSTLYKETLATLILPRFEQVLGEISIPELIKFLQLNPLPLIIQFNQVTKATEQFLDLLEKKKLSHIKTLVKSERILPYQNIIYQLSDYPFGKWKVAVGNTSINLVRLAIKFNEPDLFMKEVCEITRLAITNSIDRFEYQITKSATQFPTLVSMKLFQEEKSSKKDILKKTYLNGLIKINIVGLAACVKLLNQNENFAGKILKQINQLIQEYQSPQLPKIMITTSLTKESIEHFYQLDYSIYGELTKRKYYQSGLLGLTELNYQDEVFFPLHSITQEKTDDALAHAKTQGCHFILFNSD